MFFFVFNISLLNSIHLYKRKDFLIKCIEILINIGNLLKLNNIIIYKNILNFFKFLSAIAKYKKIFNEDQFRIY